MTEDRRFNDTHKLNMALWLVFMLVVLFGCIGIGYAVWVFIGWIAELVVNG